MNRWDEKDEQRSAGVSGFLFVMILVFSIGFVIGILWGLSWADVVPDRDSFGVQSFAYGEVATSSSTYHITLYDGISIGDSVVTTTP